MALQKHTPPVEKTTKKKFKSKLVRYAKQALHGLDESHVFVGVLDGRTLDDTRIAFMIQLAHCILMNKTIIIPVPFGIDLPPKLAQVADRVVRYDPERLESLQENLAAALSEMGVNMH